MLNVQHYSHQATYIILIMKACFYPGAWVDQRNCPGVKHIYPSSMATRCKVKSSLKIITLLRYIIQPVFN